MGAFFLVVTIRRCDSRLDTSMSGHTCDLFRIPDVHVEQVESFIKYVPEKTKWCGHYYNWQCVPDCPYTSPSVSYFKDDGLFVWKEYSERDFVRLRKTLTATDINCMRIVINCNKCRKSFFKSWDAFMVPFASLWCHLEHD